MLHSQMNSSAKRAIILAMSSMVIAIVVGASVEAQRRRRPQKREAPPPPSAAISEALGDLAWGMGKDEVIKRFGDQIRERYAERFKQVRKRADAIGEDRVRNELQEELRRLRESYTAFSHGGTEYRGHFTEVEFSRGHGEAMLRFDDSNSQNYYFFVEDKLWKWYKAFNAEVFGGRTFEEFAAALQGRFGPARERRVALRRGERPVQVLEWENPTTRARAMHNRFYGFYSLIIEDRATVDRIEEIRGQPPAGESVHPVVQQVTGDDEGPGTNADVVDAITGRRRNAPEQAPP